MYMYIIKVSNIQVCDQLGLADTSMLVENQMCLATRNPAHLIIVYSLLTNIPVQYVCHV